MGGVFFAIALFVVSFKGIASVPLRTIVGDGSLEKLAKIKEAQSIANQQIVNMQAVLNGPHPENHDAFKDAFGPNANVEQIKKNVNLMADGKLRIPNPTPNAEITQGGTDLHTKAVSFGPTFYSSTSKIRAGTLIHEAAHALFNAVDYFRQNGTPHDPKLKFDKTKALVGYKDSHLETLKEHFSHNLHHNADSYRYFAESCPEARAFFKRALQETDPVHHINLLRRGVRACAYRPKGAAKVTASKRQNKAFGSKTTVKKIAGSKRPVLVRTAESRKAANKLTVAKKASPRVPKPVARHTGKATLKKTGDRKATNHKLAVAKKAGPRRPKFATRHAGKATSQKAAHK